MALPAAALKIYSVGISTAGAAELRMAESNPERHITATTIDEKGVDSARKQIMKHGINKQIDVRLEDVSKPLPYPDEHFDYIYARLVLHYLPEQALAPALRELYRVLQKGGKLFIVVRSADCPDAIRDSSTLDIETGLTTYIDATDSRTTPKKLQRFFHSKNSITEFVQAAGFGVDAITSYDEKLFQDFNRTIEAPHFDKLIELIATK